MQLIKIRQLLQHQLAALSVLGAKASELQEIKDFEEFLGRYEQLAVADFCNFYEAQPKQQKPKKSSAKTQSSEPSALAKSYTEKLQSECEDSAAVFAELESDKRVTLSDLKAIASSLLGLEAGYNSKKNAIAGIASWVRRASARENRSERVGEGF